MSPHTVANVYGLLVSMFRAAAVAGLVETSPCILTRTEIGSDDGDTDGAGRYMREQLVHMISSPKLPEHARVFTGLGGLAGLRLGAISGLRWSYLDESAKPLWRLTSARTYDGRPTKSGKLGQCRIRPGTHPAGETLPGRGPQTSRPTSNH